ncbi:beta-ketoacyl-ACP synthase III [Spongiibacter sp. KMU-158]|uniref:Beta-ketoacyl-ACP synthase III n=1 Tax=Spongiibacter pelagi TaxID=2760804 RepID=A0A927GW50_9GAMM|nr:beta-ketoacyl-ACP synthase III [Spongiibacter pelagi]MBD2858064.1 beta-ketoacyl-ACP synthase III [Spongiibacter pelagi]
MSNTQVVISGTGLWTPENTISNEELVEAYNAYATQFNTQNAAAIQLGEVEEKPLSTAEFIEKASGIKSRYVYVKDGILDIDRMTPRIPVRPEEQISDQAEMAVAAARKALAAANKSPADIDAVIVSCAYTQRAYPAIAIEVQNELGIEGFGFDMLVACSAATFALQRAWEMVTAGTAKAVLVINPELTSPQLNFRDRDSHFIFGDVATAVIVERADTCKSEHSYDILGTKAVTSFSNNIRSNFGYLATANDDSVAQPHNYFHQQGRKVFKEVCPMAAEHIATHVQSCGIQVEDITRWWLHQANINMNVLIARKLLGRDPEPSEAPIILDRFANTASAGSIIAFNLYHEDLKSGDHGLICSFGAGYSIGSLVIRKR